MTKLWLVFFGVCVIAAGLALSAYGGDESLEADRVVEKYLAAVGGREALSSIEDRTLTAKLMVMGMTGTMEWHEKVPNKMHQTVDMVIARVETWFDGERGYRIDPMLGAGPYSDEDVEEAKQNYVVAPLLSYKQRGWTARYLGEEPVGDQRAYVVEFTDEKGKVSTYYFDTSSYYLVKLVSPLPAREGPGNQELSFSDYREVDGVKFPYMMTRATPGMASEIVIESIELNTGLEDSLFRYARDPRVILAQHLEAIGGQEAWQKLNSIRRDAALHIGEMQGTATTVWKAPEFFYHRAEIGPAVAEVGSNGERGWMGDQTADTVAVKNWKLYAYLMGGRYLLPGAGIEATYKGTEKVGEREAYVVDIRLPFGADLTCYYDKENYLLLKDVSRHSAPGIDNLLIETLYDDYRSVGPVKLPFHFREVVPLTPPMVAAFEVTSYQLDQPTDDSMFSGPASPETRPQ